MPAVELRKFGFSLQKKLSSNVPLVLVNLVGKVMAGKKLCAIRVSKKRLHFSSVFISRRLKLKSPDKTIFLYFVSK